MWDAAQEQLEEDPLKLRPLPGQQLHECTLLLGRLQQMWDAAQERCPHPDWKVDGFVEPHAPPLRWLHGHSHLLERVGEGAAAGYLSMGRSRGPSWRGCRQASAEYPAYCLPIADFQQDLLRA